MKIIYYSTAYYAAHGGSNHSKAFVNAARKNKHITAVTVFPPEGNIRKPISNSPTGKGPLFSFIKKSGLAAIFRLVRRNRFYLTDILTLIEKENPDALVIRLDSNYMQISRIKKRFPGCIVATEVNASPFDEGFKDVCFRSMLQAQERKHLSHADLNFFVSGTLRRKIMGDEQKAERDFILSNGVDINLFTPSSDKKVSKAHVGFPLDKIVIGYVGTLDVTKRLDVLLESFAALYKIRGDVYFVIIGDGPEFTKVKKKQLEYKLTDCLLLTGSIQHAEVPKYLQAFDIGLHHAANDYMCPLKLFEYFATGIPVIGPDTPAVREVFENEKQLYLCAPDADNIVEKVMLYLKDQPKADRMAKAGMELVRSKYTWQINAEKVISAIKSLRRS